MLLVSQDAEKDRQRRSRIAQRLTVRLRVRFASVLAAALLDSLFTHPAGLFTILLDSNTRNATELKRIVSEAC